MIRTINERLRVDNKVVLERRNKNLSRILFALRTEIGKDGKSAFERHKKQKPNTPKTAMVNEFISERDPNLQIEEEDFRPDVDSTVLIRERTCGSKLEGTFAKRKAKIVSESKHTITILPNKGRMVTLSKRDVALKTNKAAKRPVCEKKSSEEDLPQCSKTPTEQKETGRKRTARFVSTSTEEENSESGGETTSQTKISEPQTEEKKQGPRTAVNQNSTSEEAKETPEQSIENSEAEEGEVTEATRSETETMGYGHSEEEGEVKEKCPIKGEAKFETTKRKTRSGRMVKKPDWLGQNVMVSVLTKENHEEEAENEKNIPHVKPQ